MVKILLINPVVSSDYNRFLSKVYQVKSVTLSYLSSLIPKEHDVTIVDEAYERVDFNADVDLVGITALTITVNRAYRIAARFRARGVKVVMGGPHVSAMPEEAALHSDAVAIGNAEGYIGDLIEDAALGKLKQFYRNEIPASIPRNVNGVAHGRWMTSLLASRGCELSCSFCTMQNVFGDFYLQRTEESVREEIRRIESPYLAFIDDNFYGVRRAARSYYESLMKVASDSGLKWMAQVRLPALSSDEVLEKFRKYNCAYVLIGFESINPNNTLDIAKQKIDKERYLGAVEKIRSYGIGVIGYFIFGFDDDTKDVIDETVEFCIDSKIELASFCALTPYPGTPVYREMKSSGRLLSDNWDDYNLAKVVYQPKNFSPRELEGYISQAKKRFYSFSSIRRRMGVGKNYQQFSQYIVPNVLRRLGMTGLK